MGQVISTLADISLMWLIVLSFIACLVPLGIAFGLVYGMHKLRQALRPVFAKGQQITAQISEGTDRISLKAAEPFIDASARASRVKGTTRGLVKRFIRRQT